jgi:hypothetical protein
MRVILLILIFSAACNADKINDGTTEILWQQERYSTSNGISCEYEGNDLSSVSSVSSSKCILEICRNNKECTHYTWTSQNGGTCYLKTGSVSKSDAKFKDPYTTYPQTWLCGIDNSKITSDESKPRIFKEMLSPIVNHV